VVAKIYDTEWKKNGLQKEIIIIYLFIYFFFLFFFTLFSANELIYVITIRLQTKSKLVIHRSVI
jgi:hypothetical protein